MKQRRAPRSRRSCLRADDTGGPCQRQKRARGGADLVIAIVHADKMTGTALMNSHAVDLVLSGHNHDLHIDFDGRTALVESEQDANYVTVSTLMSL